MADVSDPSIIETLTSLENQPRAPGPDEYTVPFDLIDAGRSGDALLGATAEECAAHGIIHHTTTLPLGLGLFDPDAGDAVKLDLEARYLLPKPCLDLDSLLAAQRMIDREPDWMDLVQVEPSRNLTTLKISRDVITGHLEFWNWEEQILPNHNLTAKNSTSFGREPAVSSDFVRGNSTNMPFAPGGLDQAVQIDDDLFKNMEKLVDDLTLFEETEFLSIPPGFDRGLHFDDMIDVTPSKATTLNIDDILSGGDDLALQFMKDEESDAAASAQKTAPTPDSAPPPSTDVQEIDELLPEVSKTAATAVAPPENPHREWAHVIDVDQGFPDFYDLVPELAHEFPFELDVFQKQAVYHLENGDSVFVAAHTSAGKTVVAEYAIALAQKHMTRAIYTSPIKALSNQKFRDFRTTFDDVGILTGDVQIKPEATCLVMTTEILRSMLYRGADLIRDVEFVIFDEVHYVNDIERGVVWEEVIIMLPAHVNLILLSATVPNTREFADWVGRTKKKDIYVISTAKRPVPLEHYLYVPQSEKNLHKVVDAQKRFLVNGWKAAQDAVSGSKKEDNRPAAQRGGRGGNQAGRGGRGGHRGGGTTVVASAGSRAGSGGRSMGQTDRNMYVHMLGLLKKKQLLPVIIFTFSKKKCEEYANGLVNVDFTAGAAEKSEIHVFIERCVGRLKGSDRELPQILRVRDLLSRGIAVHHGGLLPIVKEMVEILFTRGLIKCLFATETFAMGVNAPARCVVFSSTRKHDGRSFRELFPGEYTQMSGRAGRRGLDDMGLVIVACGDEVPDTTALQKMILGQPTKLASQFRLTYNMILNLLRVEALKVEEMIKRSFSENGAQKLLPEQQKLHAETSKLLSAFAKLQCPICVEDIYEYHDLSTRIVILQHELRELALKTPLGRKAMSAGRVVVISGSFYRNAVAAVLGVGIGGDERTCSVLVLTESAVGPAGAADHTAFKESAPLPVTRVLVPSASRIGETITTVPLTDIAVVTKLQLRLDVDLVLAKRDRAEISRIAHELHAVAADISKAGEIPEHDWSKIRDIEFQERTREKAALMGRLGGFQCTHCSDLIEHYGQVHNERMLQQQVSELSHSISDQNLELLPDYHQRVDVLKLMNYVDEATGTVTLKGRVACEINTADELILTELILENVLADYEPAEMVALLSCFVFQEKTQSTPVLTPRLEKGVKAIVAIAERVADVQRSCGLDVRREDALANVKFGLVEVVHEWAKGLPFKHITDLTDVLEGSIVRTIVRLEETCREVQGTARLIGDAGLFKKMEAARESIKRDIVFAASLYF
ncbi:antiviral helicase [Geranomyces variabilis]|nr:antiviral helicase [Geranomyces variabilis]